MVMGPVKRCVLMASLVCLVLTSLSFRNKVLGYLAIPLVIFILLFRVSGYNAYGDFGYGIIGILTTFAPLILFSIATMLDEKNRMKG